MKVDNSNIHKSYLLAFINQTYDIGEGQKIEFIPKGEEGYCYSLETKSRGLYFVKATKTVRNLSPSLSAIYFLHFREKRTYLLPPIQSKAGEVVEHFDSYQISVFPYINGNSIYEGKLTLSDTSKIAFMVADLHKIEQNKVSDLLHEQFDNPFEKNILKLMHTLEMNDKTESIFRQQARELFATEQDDIYATLRHMRAMQKQIQSLPLSFSITHGDPNYANIMRDSNGNLHLIDCEWLEYGPIERDIMAFTENEYFEQFLLEYLQYHQNAKLHLEVFEFYLYRWALQEISDYGSQLFFGSTGDEENEHAWKELQPYLPIPHEEIRKSLKNIKRSWLNVKINKIQ
ncbi:phosphotransferase [Bacillus sp. FJAT-49732]|uniref:Phosphotransferase n=1 Tax=Lederbergia citrisecunda TaxID=2833583 RepID=A0A942TLD5_9BACI|nr:phosphotransferase [Lederbergia citrisecunda]